MQSVPQSRTIPRLPRSPHAAAAGATRSLEPCSDTRPQSLHLGMRHASGLLAIYIAAARATERDMRAHPHLAKGVQQVRAEGVVTVVGQLALCGSGALVANRRCCDLSMCTDCRVEERRAKGEQRPAVRARALGKENDRYPRSQCLLHQPGC
jgi:hypothetical protein